MNALKDKADVGLNYFNDNKGLLILSDWIQTAADYLGKRDMEKDKEMGINFLERAVEVFITMLSINCFTQKIYENNKHFFVSYKSLRSLKVPELASDFNTKVTESWSECKDKLKVLTQQSKKSGIFYDCYYYAITYIYILVFYVILYLNS